MIVFAAVRYSVVDFMDAVARISSRSFDIGEFLHGQLCKHNQMVQDQAMNSTITRMVKTDGMVGSLLLQGSLVG
jgi:hypothetical protein